MYKLRLLILICLSIISQSFVTSKTFASLIVVSGDSNIGNPIDGSSRSPVNTDNATWFTNILGTGTTVKIQSDNAGLADSAGAIDNHYNSLGGVTSSVVPVDTTIDGVLLDGVDLYINMLPSDDYTLTELNSLSAFSSAGGSLFFLGDHGNIFSAQNGRINSALGSLGSSMSIVNAALDMGFRTTTNIEADPLNSGVSDFTYALTSSVSGGTSLIRTRGGTTFIAYEVSSVPVPASVWLFGSGLLGLIGIARRKKLA